MAFKQFLDGVEKTQGKGAKNGKLERLPLDTAAVSARRAVDRCVQAETELHLAQDARKAAIEQHDAYVAHCVEQLKKAELEHARAVKWLMKEVIEAGGLDRVKDLNALMRAAKEETEATD